MVLDANGYSDRQTSLAVSADRRVGADDNAAGEVDDMQSGLKLNLFEVILLLTSSPNSQHLLLQFAIEAGQP